MNRNEALELLKKYNKEEFHIRHALTVEKTILAMRESEDLINKEMV